MDHAAIQYRSDREADVVLRDGCTVHVRPVRRSDESAIRDFLARISEESLTYRFFGLPNLDWVVAWSVDVDARDRFGLVVEAGSPPVVIAHAAYVRIDSRCAEVAFLVADAWQEHGIATILLRRLASAARQQGISIFTAQVLADNHRMLDVFRESGFPVEMHSAGGVVEAEFPTLTSADRRRGNVAGVREAAALR